MERVTHSGYFEQKMLFLCSVANIQGIYSFLEQQWGLYSQTRASTVYTISISKASLLIFQLRSRRYRASVSFLEGKDREGLCCMRTASSLAPVCYGKHLCEFLFHEPIRQRDNSWMFGPVSFQLLFELQSCRECMCYSYLWNFIIHKILWEFKTNTKCCFK